MQALFKKSIHVHLKRPFMSNQKKFCAILSFHNLHINSKFGLDQFNILEAILYRYVAGKGRRPRQNKI